MSMMDQQLGGRSQQDRDLVLPPNAYAYVLDSTKGKVSVYVGPHKTSLAGTDTLVIWDKANRKFAPVDSIDRAINTFIQASEGQYVVLTNPAQDVQPPPIGVPTEAVQLNAGRSVIIPGPTSFPLWPGQSAEAVEGHHLRHNQYLMVRVVNPEEAAANWNNAVMAPQTTQGDDEGTTQTVADDTNFTMGQLRVIKGTDVSFYIPSTGVEVVRDPDTGEYVREAATLEQLEYCILLDESGEKRYMQGPDVVFPEPTETFITNEHGDRKFRAIELDDRTGIYVKVIAEYEDEEGHHDVGEELFITGSSNGIYFPRSEHSIIEYDGKRKHHAIAIPVGEGRYVLNRGAGQIDLIRGPQMFLPDPREQVVTRRVLDPRTVSLLYPGNEEALRVNAEYRREAEQLDPGEYLGGSERVSLRGMASSSAFAEDEYGGEREQRRSQYTPPRTVVLDTKYDGAVAVNIWPGYAVMVTDKSGRRRVEVGPQAILLEYDENLMPMELSTGKPKTTDHLLRTAYLRTTNNKISDIFEVETKDLVKVQIKISMLANFEANSNEERERWFDVENYVKVLCDRVRSMMRGKAKRYSIQEFYRDSVDIVRDTILGVQEEGERVGLRFNDFGLHVFDVEVLAVEIRDHDVADQLSRAQSRALQGAIELSEAEEESVRIAAREELTRRNAGYRHETKVEEARLAAEQLQLKLESNMANIAADLEQARARVEVQDLDLETGRKQADQNRELQKALDEVEITRLKEEATIYKERLEAMNPQFAAALQHFGETSFVEKLVEALGPVAAATGVTTADLFTNVFKDTPFEGLMRTMAQRPLASIGSNGGTSRDDYRG